MKLEIKDINDQNYTDITDYIALEGIERSFNALDSDGAGRTIDGTMQRKLLTNKVKLEITCIPLTTTALDTLTALLKKEWLSVKLTTNTGASTYTMYPGNTLSSGVLIVYGGQRDELWSGIEFSLIEK